MNIGTGAYYGSHFTVKHISLSRSLHFFRPIPDSTSSEVTKITSVKWDCQWREIENRTSEIWEFSSSKITKSREVDWAEILYEDIFLQEETFEPYR